MSLEHAAPADDLDEVNDFLIAGARLVAEASSKRHWNDFLDLDRTVLCSAVLYGHHEGDISFAQGRC